MEARAVPGPSKALAHIKTAAIFIPLAFVAGTQDGLSVKMTSQLTVLLRTHTLVLTLLILNLGQPRITNRMWRT